jgi:hypothetical protein
MGMFIRQIILILISCFVGCTSFCQENVYDTTDPLYAAVDFSFKDDLNVWRYKARLRKPSNKNASLGYIIFWRTEKWDDNTDKEFHMGWNAGIIFQIFRIKDSALGLSYSRFARNSTQCSPPRVGGDWFILSNFLFVNKEPCLACFRKKNATDYCRPVMNQIFSQVYISNVSSVKDIIKQLPIQEENPSKQ